MKVVLLKDVAGVGRRNEVKIVSDGYALNFLIPKKLAEIGSAAAIGRAERLKSEEGALRRVHEDLVLKNLSALEGISFDISSKANEKGHLFASIHREDIAAELKKQKGIDILPEFLVIEKPIKEVGEHKIPVKVQDKSAMLTLVVKGIS